MTRRSEIVAALDATSVFGSPSRVYSGVVGGDQPVPPGTTRPYAIVLTDISETAELRGDSGQVLALGSTVQVSVFEDLDDETESVNDTVRQALDGLSFTGAGSLRLVWDDSVRLFEEEAGLVHRAHSCTLVRLG